MTKNEALKLALEALESHIVWFSRDTMIGKSMRENANKAITAIEQALAQPEQEPVGEVVIESMGVRGSDAMQVRIHFYKEIPPIRSKVYTTPLQRPWIGLTDEEIDKIRNTPMSVEGGVGFSIYLYARAIERKLKEKNT